jgi:hypothetical protein
VDTAPKADSTPVARRFARAGLKIVASIVFASAAALGGHKFYVDQYAPARDINALGVTEIGMWSDREIARVRWPNGSSVTFKFAISAEAEAKLREQCMPNDEAAMTIGICTFALRARDRETMWADVGPNAVRLHIFKGVVPPSDTSLERTRER